MMVRAQWLQFNCATHLVPAVAVTIPLIIYRNILVFFLSVVGYTILCFLFLCVSAVTTSPHDSAEPQLELETPSERKRRSALDEMSSHAGKLKVVPLDRLEKELASRSAASVMTALYTTDELLTSVNAADTSFAIISYRQVRCKSDDFTLGTDAFLDAVSKARKAGVDAIWLDGWCYRQQGPYNHADFCTELAAVMRNVAAVVWLPRSRANAPPSYQFRLWCTFEASVVAERRLPVFIAGRGIATAQVAMKHLGTFLFAFPGIKPPPEVRSLAYVNAIYLLLSVAAPIFAPFFAIIIVSGTLGLVLPAYSVESAYTRNGQMVLRAMADGVKRAKLGVSAGASVQGARRRSMSESAGASVQGSRRRSRSERSRGDSSTTSRSSAAAPEDSGVPESPLSPPPSPPSPRATADGAACPALHTVDAAAHSAAHAVAHAGQEAAHALVHPVEAAHEAARSLDEAAHEAAHALDEAIHSAAAQAVVASRGLQQMASRGLQRSLTSAWTTKEETLVASLHRMLPWLPSYDRRDALVVQTLLGMVASQLTQTQQGGTESICALAASCFSAAKLMPSAGDPVGQLDVQSWLAQKAIDLPMTRPIPLPALAKLGWRTFRGSPDQLITPGGRLRVMGSSSTPTPTPSSEWDATQLEVVREAPIAWQMALAVYFLVAAVLFIGLYITLALDFTTAEDAEDAEDADQVDLTYTIWLMATVGWLSTCALCLAGFCFHVRYPMANYPHPVHGPSFAMILGGDGYHALKDFAAYLAFHVACSIIPLIPLLVMDTAAFTRSSALLRTSYSSDLARERHPASPVAAQVAYIASLASMLTWSIHFSIDASYATWHMWHCGRRAGRRYFIRSPDSKSTTVVSFASAQSDV